jgi:hypothetical protein
MSSSSAALNASDGWRDSDDSDSPSSSGMDVDEVRPCCCHLRRAALRICGAAARTARRKPGFVVAWGSPQTLAAPLRAPAWDAARAGARTVAKPRRRRARYAQQHRERRGQPSARCSLLICSSAFRARR